MSGTQSMLSLRRASAWDAEDPTLNIRKRTYVGQPLPSCSDRMYLVQQLFQAWQGFSSARLNDYKSPRRRSGGYVLGRLVLASAVEDSVAAPPWSSRVTAACLTHFGEA
ncbi:uncharacterized protein LOC135815061 isoform X2 [Sycon ciliatum]|uniref:uncharacterized protein LOC135815061 isoform X2 n=1 Tax=Sycon ciliatum TaxID=27933 RepID=UPI0031F6BB9A